MIAKSYCDTIDTFYSDGFEREKLFRSAGDMLSPAAPVAVGFVGRIAERLTNWRMKRAGRLALRDLTDDQLRDVGLTRWDVREELGKSYIIE